MLSAGHADSQTQQLVTCTRAVTTVRGSTNITQVFMKDWKVGDMLGAMQERARWRGGVTYDQDTSYTCIKLSKDKHSKTRQ